MTSPSPVEPLAVSRYIVGGIGLSPVLLRRAVALRLPHFVRAAGHFEADDTQGRRLHVQVAGSPVLRNGDVLVASDGSLIRVEAAPEPVLVVTACTEHGAPADLLRAAWWLGGRHVAMAIEGDHLLIAPDEHLQHALQARHLTVTLAEHPFDPMDEGGSEGAHAHGGHHHHEHEHEHGHDHEHGHGH